ncbi:MAG: MMPL family transporter [Planctomycetota bacterium]
MSDAPETPESDAPEEDLEGYTWPWIVGVAALAMVLVSALSLGLAWVTVDVSNQAMFVEGDPTLEEYDHFRDDFGSDEAVYVLVEVPDAFSDPYYQLLIDLGEDLVALDWIDSVRSPLRSPLAYSEGDEIISKSVTEVGPVTPEERSFWREKATEFRPFKGLLISPDAKNVGFLARLRHTPGEHLTPQDRREIVEQLTSVLESPKYKDLPHSSLGSPINPHYFSQILQRELKFATGLGLLAAMACLFLLFRSLRAVFAPLLVSISALLSCVGLMGWLGMPVTVLTPILISLLICVGVADAMHLLAAYQRLVVNGTAPGVAMRVAVHEVWRPCLYTSVTTAVGFAALITSEIVPVTHLGIVAALGSLLAYGLTFAISPLVALGWHPRSTPTADFLTGLLDRLLTIANRGRWAVAGVSALLAALALLGGFPTVDNDFLRMLNKGEKLRDWIEFTHERMGGVVSAEIVLEPLEPGDTEKLALILRQSSEFADWLEQHPLIRQVGGIYSAVEEMHVLYDGPREVSLDDAVNEQLLLMVQSADPEFYEQHLTLDGSAIRLTMRMDMAASSAYSTLKDEIEAELTHRFRGPDDEPLVSVYLTGAAILMSRANDYLVQTQIESFGIALVCVSLLILLGVRNLKLGLLAMIPNLLPVALVIGALAWIDYRVNMTTALVGAIVLGIIVDDTIHVIDRLRIALRRQPDLDAALHVTMHTAGRAVIFTSLTLAICFSIYAFSALGNVRAFGLLTAGTFVLALIADLLVLPALPTSSAPRSTALRSPREPARLGCVVIGRNEGERLQRCLRGLDPQAQPVVYVDSGSSDGSVAFARGVGALVVDLDLSRPFTAARARNAGLQRLRQAAPVEFVMFFDGDCRALPGWLAAGVAALEQDPSLAGVAGRLRERYPEASLYNQLCDLEWDAPPGPARALGGTPCIASRPSARAGHFDPTPIAGEEPELCLRLRRLDYRLERLADDMAWHDAAITRFGQWWQRAVRSGYAYAEGAQRHGDGPERYRVREVRRIVFWGILVPFFAFGAAGPSMGLSLILGGLYPLNALKVFAQARQRGRSLGQATLYAGFMTLAKLPEAQGFLRYHLGRLRGQASGLIEYKDAPA